MDDIEEVERLSDECCNVGYSAMSMNVSHISQTCVILFDDPSETRPWPRCVDVITFVGQYNHNCVNKAVTGIPLVQINH